MSTTIKTVYDYDYRTTVIIINADIERVKNRWIGDNNYGLEKGNIEYMKRGFKL